ncbi:FHA domain-containing protein, partial [Burkholderia sp. HMSC10F09]
MSTSIIEPHGDGALPGGAGSGAAALASPWNLCFLSGPMYGRTMSLARGANWVGTAADCEVILPDREIGAKQVCLQVGALAVTVQNHGGDTGAPVLLNDEPLGSGRRSLTPQDVVTVGSIRFGIARHAQASVAVPDDTGAPDVAPAAPWLGWLTGGLR